MEVPAAEAVDDAGQLDAAAVQRGGDLRVERRRAARRVGAVENGDGSTSASSGCDRAAGKGRNETSLSSPTGIPASRSSSTTSLIVPAVEPSATSAREAPSSRYSLERLVAAAREQLELAAELARGPRRRCIAAACCVAARSSSPASRTALASSARERRAAEWGMRYSPTNAADDRRPARSATGSAE